MSTLPRANRTAKPQAADDFLARPGFAEVSRKIRHAPPRYRNEIGKFSVFRSSACVECGKCVDFARTASTRAPRAIGSSSALKIIGVSAPLAPRPSTTASRRVPRVHCR